jgi:hypothetical protein
MVPSTYLIPERLWGHVVVRLNTNIWVGVTRVTVAMRAFSGSHSQEFGHPGGRLARVFRRTQSLLSIPFTVVTRRLLWPGSMKDFTVVFGCGFGASSALLTEYQAATMCAFLAGCFLVGEWHADSVMFLSTASACSGTWLVTIRCCFLFWFASQAASERLLLRYMASSYSTTAVSLAWRALSSMRRFCTPSPPIFLFLFVFDNKNTVSQFETMLYVQKTYSYTNNNQPWVEKRVVK